MWIVRLVTKRLALGVVTLTALAAIVFFISTLVPGDPARVAVGENATPDQIAAARERLGLDKPVVMQFVMYLGRMVRGDLGVSISTHSPVSSGLAAALPTTFELVLLAILLMVVVALPTATIAALRQGHHVDTGLRTSAVFAAGIPTFWLALLAQFILAGKLQILPISGAVSRQYVVQHHTGFMLVDSTISGGLAAGWDAFQHLLMPASVLAVLFGAQLFRALRTEIIRVLSREHIAVARAKGVPRRILVLNHVLPNAVGPAITILGVQFGMMVGSAVLVESIFALPGLGSYLTNAVSSADINALLGAVLVTGVVVVLASLLVDVLQALRDPRVRAAQNGGRR
ncbi:ABC transporter permease [Micromonospora sp. CB01531]|uniref:ABC transporter permease n=1 Tax=Micromonospora sp. CB01531 TaxID=1718947 RepID=UPI0009406571|nr:ABC transporter permease [Micromonospora sp. CB01531]OKI51497.1 nickel ABC transporter permease [Micromonospora sp. CB01531]